ncbi:MAG: prolipoprotein diacylglyceryl transferase [Candidatus Kapabacteria bacterium]|nr:prolipoprotein diacylglyceryl transferase [Candidatus Kapabacteria bacterium]MCS7169725.1 prolipoprotein diacylglyceryl transferase [Candidatus Kapabacteria bacterium]MDW7996269.1 prolipoprotein diacylglyceryl transferase [Bacteroidota bacterium]MDW8225960.1 prolipoprotein diacylglyceryl transferase [Bacteroidota bacterium]
MLPVLIKIGPITIYSFGAMVALGFLTAYWLSAAEFRRRGIPKPKDVASSLLLIAFIGGLAGAKLFHLLEHPQEFLADPLGAIFSPAGLTFHGGFLVATVGFLLYLRRRRLPLWRIADAIAPALILAYGIGRIGCHLAGDGDYGIPTNVPWAVTYPNGTVPTLAHLNPELRRKYEELFPGRPVPEDIPVHPTPIYEFLACVGVFILLWSLRKSRQHAEGWLFGLYLVLAGLERLLVEFIRLNPTYWGLSQAQWVSLVAIGVGGFLLVRRWANTSAPRAGSA